LGIVTDFKCPRCDAILLESRTDDVGNEWYYCEQCDEWFINPLKQRTPEPEKYFNDKGRFISKRLGDEILEKYYMFTHPRTKEIYVYSKGVWLPKGEEIIAYEVKESLGESFKQYYLNEVTAYIRASTYHQPEEPPANLINLKNGIYDLETDTLKSHSPNLYFFNQIPVEYNPDADCPKIKKFLDEVTGSEEDKQVLIEMAGFCLYRRYIFHKAVMLLGEGSNGKSTFLNLLKEFLGKSNVSSRSLFDLVSNRFAKADLYGKLANIYPDLTDKALVQTGIFKMLTGGDPIEAEKKYRDPFIFVNYAKLLFSANKLPQVPKDDTYAFFRRWIIITFPNKFEGENCNPNLLDELTDPNELSGFLNLALEGLKRLLKEGRFTLAPSVEEIREDYIRKSDPIKAFCMDMIVQDAESWVSKQKLYSAFTEYCRKMKLPPVTQKTFFQNIYQHITVIESRQKINGKRERVFKGIKLATDFKDEHQKTLDRVQDVQDVQGSTPVGTYSNSVEKKGIENMDMLDILDTSHEDSKFKIGVTCGSCRFFHKKECPMENPQLIQPSAVYADKCGKYQPSKEW